MKKIDTPSSDNTETFISRFEGQVNDTDYLRSLFSLVDDEPHTLFDKAIQLHSESGSAEENLKKLKILRESKGFQTMPTLVRYHLHSAYAHFTKGQGDIALNEGGVSHAIQRYETSKAVFDELLPMPEDDVFLRVGLLNKCVLLELELDLTLARLLEVDAMGKIYLETKYVGNDKLFCSRAFDLNEDELEDINNRIVKIDLSHLTAKFHETKNFLEDTKVSEEIGKEIIPYFDMCMDKLKKLQKTLEIIANVNKISQLLYSDDIKEA